MLTFLSVTFCLLGGDYSKGGTWNACEAISKCQKPAVPIAQGMQRGVSNFRLRYSHGWGKRYMYLFEISGQYYNCVVLGVVVEISVGNL